MHHDAEGWHTVMANNATSQFLVCRAAVRQMLAILQRTYCSTVGVEFMRAWAPSRASRRIRPFRTAA